MKQNLSLEESFALIERHLNKQWRSDVQAQTVQQMSFNEFDYLQAVDELQKPRLSDLAEHMQVSKASASNMVSKLEKRELLRRTPSADDKRSVLLELTIQSQEILNLDNRIYQQVAGKIKSQMSSEDYTNLKRLLSLACQNI